MRFISTKPPIGTPLNRAHPLSKGLVGAYLMNENGGLNHYNSFDNRVYSSTGLTTVRGTVVDTVAKSILLDPLYSASRSFSFFMIYIPIGGATLGSQALYNSTNGTGGLYIRLGGGTLNFLKSQTVSIASVAITEIENDAYPMYTAFTIDSLSTANYAMYEKGIKIGSGTTSQTFTTGTPRLGSEGTGGGMDVANCRFQYILIYNRAITATEVGLLYVNPYQMFTPHINQIFSPLPAPIGLLYNKSQAVNRASTY